VFRVSSACLDHAHTHEISLKFGNISSFKKLRNLSLSLRIGPSNLTEGFGLSESGIKVFEGTDWKAQRTARKGVIRRRIFCCEEIRKDVQSFVSPGFSV